MSSSALPPVVSMNSSGKPTSTTRIIAKLFGRRHDNVLARVDDLIEKGAINRLDFKAVKYTDAKGEQRPMYELTERGFLIAMPFIGGSKAKQGQVKLVDEFLFLRDKENHRITQAARQAEQRCQLEWQQARSQGKLVRREETDVIKQFVQYAFDQGSKNAAIYYTHFTKAVYQAIFDTGKSKVKGLRNDLDGIQLMNLATAERVAGNVLQAGMAQGLPYKDVFKGVKATLGDFSKMLGKSVVMRW